MRLFGLVLVVACGIAASPPRPSAPPRPIVILVHGRGQLGQDTAMLRRDWKLDLDSSLKLVGMPPLRDEDVRLAWYADVLDPESDSLCGPVSVASDSLGFADVARGFLMFLGSTMPTEDSRAARGVMSDMLYALDPAKRCAAERRVGAIIDAALREQRPVIVVAYSLGSLVTYGYLRSPQSPRMTSGELRLVTVGSPLGLRVIRDLVFGDSSEHLRVPAGVVDWANVYDPSDFISAPLADIMSAGKVRDRSTHASDQDDPHNFERYLRDRATGSAVMQALCASARNEFAACATP